MANAIHLELVVSCSSYEQAKARACLLLKSLISESQRNELAEKGVISVRAASGKTYVINPYTQTSVYSGKRLIAYACMQLSIPAPTYDRMLAEYLLIVNDEAEYLRKVNWFSQPQPIWKIALIVGLSFLVGWLVPSFLGYLF